MVRTRVPTVPVTRRVPGTGTRLLHVATGRSRTNSPSNRFLSIIFWPFLEDTEYLNVEGVEVGDWSSYCRVRGGRERERGNAICPRRTCSVGKHQHRQIQSLNSIGLNLINIIN